jgi:NitT/TauT family transport system substrate-binding protein
MAAATALKAAVPEVDVATAAEQWKASIPLMVNDIAKKDGNGAFEPALLATTWKWVAEAQNMPIDKLNPETAVSRDFLK